MQMDAEERERLFVTLCRFFLCGICAICAICVCCWVPRRSVQSGCDRETRNLRLLLEAVGCATLALESRTHR